VAVDVGGAVVGAVAVLLDDVLVADVDVVVGRSSGTHRRRERSGGNPSRIDLFLPSPGRHLS
jgi:hypothetical protein